MKHKKTIIILFITFIFTFSFSDVIFADSPTVDTFNFTDDLGREISIYQPQRVVTLAGSFADIYYLAGGVEQIVGTADDTFREFDVPLSKETINIGSAKDPSLESIITLNPDLVIASCNTPAHMEMLESFENMGICAAYFKVSTFDEYLHMLNICTEITGCIENYEKYGTSVTEKIAEANELIDGSAPTVLYIRVSSTGCKVKNSVNSVLGEMLKDLGCINIADNNETLLEDLSIEAIVLNDPDFIFLVFQSADQSVAEEVYKQTLESNDAWQSLSAVKEGRIYFMDQRLYNLKPNAKWGEAYEGLAKILYQ